MTTPSVQPSAGLNQETLSVKASDSPEEKVSSVAQEALKKIAVALKNPPEYPPGMHQIIEGDPHYPDLSQFYRST